MQYKRYREHNCSSRHRRWSTAAKCIWPRAVWINGEGPFALVAYCRATTVTLWENSADAESSKAFIDDTGCGGMCSGRHEIIELDGAVLNR